MPWREAPSDDAYFELSFSPNVALVSTVRRFVGDFYVKILNDPDVTSRLAVATHELLDNVVRYSIDGYSTLRVGVRAMAGTAEIRIETHNRADPKHLDFVRELVDEIDAASDAGDHYQVMLRRSAKRKDGSGLGLARVRAETDMTVGYRIDNDSVYVRASGHFPVTVEPTTVPTTDPKT